MLFLQVTFYLLLQNFYISRAHPTETKDCNLLQWINENKSTLNTPKHETLYQELQSLVERSNTINCESLSKYKEILNEANDSENLHDELSSINKELEDLDLIPKNPKGNLKKPKFSCSIQDWCFKIFNIQSFSEPLLIINNSSLNNNSTKLIFNVNYKKKCLKEKESSSLRCLYFNIWITTSFCKLDGSSIPGERENVLMESQLSIKSSQIPSSNLKESEISEKNSTEADDFDPTENLDEEQDIPQKLEIAANKQEKIENEVKIESTTENLTTENKKNTVTDVTENLEEKNKDLTKIKTEEELTLPSIPKTDEENMSRNLILNERKSTDKIQEIEIQLLKLENKFLSSTVEKRNDSLSLIHIENHILRLENSLLNMNNTLAVVQAENARLKERQDNYDRTIAQVRIENRKSSVPALPDSHTKLPEQVAKQEKQVLHLERELRKQKLRVSSLENKNMLLLKAVKKQTNTISKLLKKFDLLTAKTKNLDEHVHRLSSDTKPPQVPDGKMDEKLPEDNSESNLASEEKRDDMKLNNPGVKTGQTSEEKENAKKDKEPIVQEPSSSDREDKTHENKSNNNRSEQEKKTPENPMKPENQDGTNNKEEKTTQKEEKLKKEAEIINEEKSDNVKKGCQNCEIENKNTNQDNATSSKDAEESKEKIDKKKKNDDNKQENVKKDTKLDKESNSEDTILYRSTSSSEKDCWDHFKKGKKRDMSLAIELAADRKKILVNCEMSTGGWTVIQKRHEGNVNFFREWSEYKRGFGNHNSDHWIGLDIIHKLTNQDRYSLRIDMTNWERETVTVEYKNFIIDTEENGYRLNISGYTESKAGDSLSKHNGWKFSTKDVDNDGIKKKLVDGSCAKRFKGAWWYHKCYSSNLNGNYYRGGTVQEEAYDGISWKSWTGTKTSLKYVSMKIRPKNAN